MCRAFCPLIICFLFFKFKFWAFLVNHGGPEEKKRRDLIEELYKTEELFVENLKLVYEVKQKERFVSFQMKLSYRFL